MRTQSNNRRHLIAKTSAPGFYRKLLSAIVVSICFTMVPFLSFGQSTGGWELQKQEGDVKAYAKLSKCTDEPDQTFFIKFENASTANSYEVSYQLSVPKNPTFPPIKGTLIINAASSKEGDCKDAPLQGLRMPTPHGPASLNDLIITYTIK